jgi:hypothetical protein
LAIAHLDGDKIIIDLICERAPRFVSADVIRDYAEIMRSYRVSAVMSDNFGGGMYADDWRRNGIEFRPCPHDKSEIYRRALPLLTSKRGLMLDHGRQRLQLTSLERRVSSGYEKIDHPQTASAHDDVANAVCGVLVLAARPVEELVIPPSHLIAITADTPVYNQPSAGDTSLPRKYREGSAHRAWSRYFYGDELADLAVIPGDQKTW